MRVFSKLKLEGYVRLLLVVKLRPRDFFYSIQALEELRLVPVEIGH